MVGAEGITETEVLINRREVFERLCQSPAHVRDLVEETGQSRRTINRAVNELEALGFVERGEEGIRATMTGRLAFERLTTYLAELDDVRTAETVLDPMSSGTDVGADVVIGCEPVLGADPTPYRPVERLHDDLIEATSYRALAPTLTDSRDVRLLYEHVVTEGNPAELVVTPEVFETLRREFPRRMAAMSDAEAFSVFVGDTPPYGLVLLEDGGVGENSPATTAYVVVFDERRGIHGLLVNDSNAAVRWASEQFDTYRREADERTDALTPDADGGVREHPIPSGTTTRGQSLPVSLEREGFVEVDVEYFRNAPVADPVTAWRAGLSLAEVHTGYAVDRFRSSDDAALSSDAQDGKTVDKQDGKTVDKQDGKTVDKQDGKTAGEQSLSKLLTDALLTGAHCVVVGQPGSGKSTLCKQVACEWYVADRGPVFYRESNRGRSFQSVDALVTAATGTDGHALVVVEDAVRPEADAVFEVLDRLADRDDVSLLFDAREHEWFERDDPGDATDLDVVYVPPVSEADCARLVAHFERTTAHETAISAMHLWEAVREESTGGGGDDINEMLRLTHRLATYADPLSEGSTALEETVVAVYDDLADDEVALSVAVLATALIAAGMDVDRSLLYAVTEDDDFEAVDAAIDRLEGRILFPQEGGHYRTVHEAWATAFLSHLLAVDEGRATERFGTAVTAVLALADDPERCRQIRSHLGDPGALERVRGDPQKWADELVEAVYDLCWRRSSLSPLFGDGTHDSIDLPGACSDAVIEKRPVWLGEGFLTGGNADRAERAYERLGRDDPDVRRERLFGLAHVRYKRGEYDEAIEYYEQGLAIAEEQDDTRGEALHHKDLGLTRWRLGSYDEARKHFEACRSCARQVQDRDLESRAIFNLGTVTSSLGDYDRAQAYFRAGLENARKVGNRHREATSLNNLGCIARDRGAYDRARIRFEESLALRRELGYRSGEASCLINLGDVAVRLGSHREAAAFYEAALDIATDIDYARERGKSLRGLGVVALSRGDYERARQYLDEAMVVVEETGNRLHIVRVSRERGRLAFERGKYSAAREQAEEALALAGELGATYEWGQCQKLLGRVAAETGDTDAACEHFTDALDTFEEIGAVDDSLETLEALVESSLEDDSIRQWLDRASELVADAPEAVTEKHQEWIATHS